MDWPELDEMLPAVCRDSAEPMTRSDCDERLKLVPERPSDDVKRERFGEDETGGGIEDHEMSCVDQIDIVKNEVLSLDDATDFAKTLDQEFRLGLEVSGKQVATSTLVDPPHPVSSGRVRHPPVSDSHCGDSCSRNSIDAIASINEKLKNNSVHKETYNGCEIKKSDETHEGKNKSDDVFRVAKDLKRIASGNKVCASSISSCSKSKDVVDSCSVTDLTSDVIIAEATDVGKEAKSVCESLKWRKGTSHLLSNKYECDGENVDEPPTEDKGADVSISENSSSNIKAKVIETDIVEENVEKCAIALKDPTHKPKDVASGTSANKFPAKVSCSSVSGGKRSDKVKAEMQADVLNALTSSTKRLDCETRLGSSDLHCSYQSSLQQTIDKISSIVKCDRLQKGSNFNERKRKGRRKEKARKQTDLRLTKSETVSLISKPCTTEGVRVNEPDGRHPALRTDFTMPLCIPVLKEDKGVACDFTPGPMVAEPVANSSVQQKQSQEVSDAVKFFFQQGANPFDKFFDRNLTHLQNATGMPGARMTPSDLDLWRKMSEIQRRPRSHDAVDVTQNYHSSVDGRKLLPFQPRVPMLPFLNPDVTMSGFYPLGHKGLPTFPTGIVASTVTSGSHQRASMNPGQTQTDSTSVINLVNNVTPTGSLVTTSDGRGAQQCPDLRSLEELMVRMQNSGLQPPQPKPRAKSKNKRAIASGRGKLNHVLNKLHQAKDSTVPQDSTLQTVLGNSEQKQEQAVSDRSSPLVQCLKVVETTPSTQENIVTTFRIPSALTIIPQTVTKDKQPNKLLGTDVQRMTNIQNCVEDSVINRLKKLGTVVEVERDPVLTITPALPPLTPAPGVVAGIKYPGKPESKGLNQPDVTARCLKMLENLTQSGSIVTNITTARKPKKKRTQRKARVNITPKVEIVNKSLPCNISVQHIPPTNPNKNVEENSVPSDAMLEPVIDIVEHSTSEIPALQAPQPKVLRPSVSLISKSVPAHSSVSQKSESSGTQDVVKTKPSISQLSYALVVQAPPAAAPSASQSSQTPVVQASTSKTTAVPLPPQQPDEKFVFRIDKTQVMNLEGQRMFTCDICNGVYHKSTGLKRHYIRSHINRKFVTEYDLVSTGLKPPPPPNPDNPVRKPSKVFIGDLSNWVDSIPGLYHCGKCGACFDQKPELKTHLMEHPPVSLISLKTTKPEIEPIVCKICSQTFTKKKLYTQHQKVCLEKKDSSSNILCLFCEKSFPSILLRNKHQFKGHHPKRKFQLCFICKSEKFKDTATLFKHMCLQHKGNYFACTPCRMRFLSRLEQRAHSKEMHGPKKKNADSEPSVNGAKKDTDKENNGKTEETVIIINGKQFQCAVCNKVFGSNINASRHHRLAHGVHPRRKSGMASASSKQGVATSKHASTSSKNENDEKSDSNGENSQQSFSKAQSAIMDAETLFYSRIASNIRENLLHHLDGKLDSQEVLEYDLNTPADQAAKNKLMNFSASFTSLRGSNEKDSADSQSTSNPVSPKVPWEKFNFPKNYDGRCGLTSYIKDMSHLDISTQLTMRRNLQRLSSPAERGTTQDILADIPAGLSLIGATSAETYGDPSKKEPKEEDKSTELSGEWTRPRTYVCAVCNLDTANLWDLEEHKATHHPNVWCPHHEVLAEHASCWELVYYKRSLAKEGILGNGEVPDSPSNSSRCTKCNKLYNSQPDFHRHLLDCGGDTTWMSTMLGYSPGGTRRSRKWRPYGSRRRRQQGRRGLKRNIPNTPAKQPSFKIRTKPGDMETIQKMLANLPAKRVSRRIIGEDGEIKTRSQGTISSVATISSGSTTFKSRTGLISNKQNKRLDQSKSSTGRSTNVALKAAKDAKALITLEEKLRRAGKKLTPVKKGSTPNSKGKDVEVLVKKESEVVPDVKPEKESDDNVKQKGSPRKKQQEKKQQQIDVSTKVASSETIEEKDASPLEEDQNGVIKDESGTDIQPEDKSDEKEDCNALKNEGVMEESKVLRGKTISPAQGRLGKRGAEKTTVASSNEETKSDAGTDTKDVNSTPDKVQSDDERSKIIAAMKNTMMDSTIPDINSEQKTEAPQKKSPKSKKDDDKHKKADSPEKKRMEEMKSKMCVEENLIMCKGCGMQFDNNSACLRHMKKCVYWKDEKTSNTDGVKIKHTCQHCEQTFPFLMALLKHKCESTSEDRAMPELIREEPFIEDIPAEITSKDIPVLSPEDVSRIKAIEAAGKTVTEKPTVNKTVPGKKGKKRTSADLLMDTISQVSMETYSLDGYFDTVVKETSIEVTEKQESTGNSDSKNSATEEPESKGLDFTISQVAMETFSVDNYLNAIGENKKQELEKTVEVKNPPKKLASKSAVNLKKELDGNRSIANKKKVLPKNKLVGKIKLSLRKVNKRNANLRLKKRILNRTRKKRSTDLEILLRENKEEIPPPESLKRKNVDPLPEDEPPKKTRSSTTLKLKESKAAVTDLPSLDSVPQDEISEVKVEKTSETTVSAASDTVDTIEEGLSQETLDNKDCKAKTPQRSKNPATKRKAMSPPPESISKGKRRIIRKWDTSRPSCSNGKVYCEPCNKEVKEDIMSKHAQTSLHTKNLELKNDFDNLFPDPNRFVTSCNYCSWKFPTPFTSYKHYLQKHEETLSELIEQSMESEIAKPKVKKSKAKTSPEKKKTEPVSSDVVEKCETKDPVEQSGKQEATDLEVDLKSSELKNDSEDTCGLLPAKSSSSDQKNGLTEGLDSISENQLTESKADLLLDSQKDNQTLETKQGSNTKEVDTRILYCGVCNKGINYAIASKHSRSINHTKNVLLKNQFLSQFPEGCKIMFPVYCDKCNWHFTSPFLCYKHYLWKHSGDVEELVKELLTKGTDRSVPKAPVLDNFDTLLLKANREGKGLENVKKESGISESSSLKDVALSLVLKCKTCNKIVKCEHIDKHMNTPSHKARLEKLTDSGSVPLDCVFCLHIENSVFLCRKHCKFDDCEKTKNRKFKHKKKKLKNKVNAKDDQIEQIKSEENNDEEKSDLGESDEIRKSGKISKKKEKKSRNISQDSNSTPSLPEVKEEANTDVSVTLDRSLETKKDKLKVKTIRNRWEVSLIDPGMASDSSVQDSKVEVKSECTESPVLDKEFPERRSSVGGSEFYCVSCEKQFSSNILLLRHQKSLMHKYNEDHSNRGDKSKSNSELPFKKMVVEAQPEVEDVKVEPTTAEEKEKEQQPKSKESGEGSSEQLPKEQNPDRASADPSKKMEASSSEQMSAPSQDWTQEWVMSGGGGAAQWDSNPFWGSDSSFLSPAGCSSSLGSILDSVNKILADPEANVIPQYTIAELQSAMGATDEEMAMLQQLGERYDGVASSCSRPESVNDPSIGPESTENEDGTPTFVDLDNQAPPPPEKEPTPPAPSTPGALTAASLNSSQSGSRTNTSTVKTESTEFSENADRASCRGLTGRPRRLLSDYECREMVCPSCSRHFLGLTALQQHLEWSQCTGNTANTADSTQKSQAQTGQRKPASKGSNLWLKRRSLLSGSEEAEKKQVCWLCKEILSSPSAFESHLAGHRLKNESSEKRFGDKSDSSAEKLKSKMSNAFGGLLDRALTNLLCTKGQSQRQEGSQELSSGALQLLGKLYAVRHKTEGNQPKGSEVSQKDKDKSYGSVLATGLRQIINRGKNKTDSSNSSTLAAAVASTPLDSLALVLANGQERPYSCPICDDRFSFPSSRNKHIARAHGKFGQRCKEEKDQDLEQADNFDNMSTFEEDWRDNASVSFDSDAEEDNENSGRHVLCSDCGLRFKAMRDIIQHRKEFHLHRFNQSQVDSKDLPVSENIVDSTSGEDQGECSDKIESNSRISDMPESVPEVESSRQRLRSHKRKDTGSVRAAMEKKCTSTVMSEGEESKVSGRASPDEGIFRESKKPSGLVKIEETDKESGGEETVEIRKARGTRGKRVKLTMEALEEIAEGSCTGENRKFRIAEQRHEEVRVKAEAALRELNLPKKPNKSQPNKKWIEALKFMKCPSSDSTATKLKLTPVVENKIMDPPLKPDEPEPKLEISKELINDKSKVSDVYEFEDEEISPQDKVDRVAVPFSQQRDDKEEKKGEEKWTFFQNDEEIRFSMDS